MSEFNKIRQDEDQHIAEFALSLRNLSFLLSTIAEDESALDRENLAISLFALNRQVDLVSSKLHTLASTCRSCILGPSEYRPAAPSAERFHVPEPSQAQARKASK